jgi:serine/threonine protein kinase, bacterial
MLRNPVFWSSESAPTMKSRARYILAIGAVLLGSAHASCTTDAAPTPADAEADSALDATPPLDSGTASDADAGDTAADATVSRCANGIWDSGECGVDCGGTTCAPCAAPSSAKGCGGSNGISGYCKNPGARCELGEGSCVNSGECASGLECDVTLGEFYGLSAGTSVCVPQRPVGPLTKIATVAGSGYAGAGDGPAATATFDVPWGVAATLTGDVYVADATNHVTRKISAAGMVTTIPVGGSGVTVSAAGVAYVASETTHSVYRIGAGDVPVLLAGTGVIGYQDGPGPQAQFHHPFGIAVAKDGSVFVADKYNWRIRKIAPDGMVSTVAGSALGGLVDGVGSAAQFNYPEGITITPGGVLYVGDKYNHAIRRVTQAGVVTTVMGTGVIGVADGPGKSATVTYPLQVSMDPWGVLHIADFGANSIRTLSQDGVARTLYNSPISFFTDGPLATARTRYLPGVWADASGKVYLADSGSYRVRVMTR